MAKDYAKSFYNSMQWRKCRDGFMSSKHFVCERCGGLAVICHHKTYITPSNISDPNITLNWDNLESLCMDCHNIEHTGKGGICREGLTFDNEGNLIQKII